MTKYYITETNPGYSPDKPAKWRPSDAITASGALSQAESERALPNSTVHVATKSDNGRFRLFGSRRPTAKTMQDWRDQHEPVHGCGHMQGRGAA